MEKEIFDQIIDSVNNRIKARNLQIIVDDLGLHDVENMPHHIFKVQVNPEDSESTFLVRNRINEAFGLTEERARKQGRFHIITHLIDYGVDFFVKEPIIK